MNPSLQTILRLYREPLPPEVTPAHAPAAEVAALADVRDALDARPRARPDAAVLDAVFRAAAHGSPTGAAAPHARHDRGPARPPRRRVRHAWLAAALGALGTLAVAFVGMSGAGTGGTGQGTPAPVVAERVPLPVAPAPAVAAPAAPSAETAALAVPAAPAPDPAPALAAVAAPAPPAPDAPDVEAPTWQGHEADAALAGLEGRAARLRGRLDSTLWEKPAVSLDLPAATPGAFTTVASPKGQ